MDRLSAISAFVAVADHKGFAPAARQKRLTPSAMTRLVAGLEDHLGIRLLNRTTRTVTVTDAGARFLERAKTILAEVEEAEESARRERARPTGKLTVTAPVLFGRMHVSPVVSRYLVQYPDVSAELQLTDRRINLVEEGMDVAVRIGELSDSAMVARKVGETRRVLVGSPKYLKDAPKLESPRDLPKHRTIGFTTLSAADEWSFREAADSIHVPVRPRYLTNSADAAIGFALDGGGVTFALSYQVAELVAARKLRVVLAEFEPAPLPIQLVYPTSRLLSAKVRHFVDLIAKSCDWNFTR